MEREKKKMTESNDLEDKLDEAIRGVEKKLEEKTTVKEFNPQAEDSSKLGDILKEHLKE